jgi:hypothetical protein
LIIYLLNPGNVLLDKKIYTISVSGSAQAIVPVNPVCPKLVIEAHHRWGLCLLTEVYQNLLLSVAF